MISLPNPAIPISLGDKVEVKIENYVGTPMGSTFFLRAGDTLNVRHRNESNEIVEYDLSVTVKAVNLKRRTKKL